jgi:putative restriction endonuclease
MDDLKKYITHFKKLRRDNKNGGAPHKPILLLAVINQVSENNITSNKIKLTPELISDFREIWSQLVFTKHDCLIGLPFFHLSSEPFWKLIPNFGYEKIIGSKIKLKSFTDINRAVSHAEIDSELIQLLKLADKREILKEFLIQNYFPQFKEKLILSNGIVEITSQFLNDSGKDYQSRLKELMVKIEKEKLDEEIFIRGSIFKREVPKIYNNTCSISQMRISTGNEISMVDACHIVPFSESYDDTITNGIALSPTLHRAFDRGLLSIDNNFKVLLKSDFLENQNSAYNLSQFKGSQILLPKNSNYYPSRENLAYHRKRFGFSL